MKRETKLTPRQDQQVTPTHETVSGSAPEFASALALYVEIQGGRVGNVNPYLYQMGGAQSAAGGRSAPAASQFLHTHIEAYDGYWSAQQPPGFGYDYIVGYGTPDVRKLFGMTAYPAAGDPQTQSNP